MVVQIDVRSFASRAIPLKNQPPLTVDADRMPTLEIAAQLFKMVARWHPKILIRHGVIDHLELPEQSPINIGGNSPRRHVVDEEVVQPPIPEADYQSFTLCRMYHSMGHPSIS
jgi:hypothetical protein